MEMFFFRHAEYERLYNCTGLDIDSVPLEHRQRQFFLESIVKCVLCAVYYVLYVPCMYSIWKNMRDNSCYKLMFYIGITDLAILWILGFFGGWLNLRGDVFCSHPTLIYLVGTTTYIWMAESSADLVLAFNRCLELGSPRFSSILFSGRRTSLWIAACSLYALYYILFAKPGLYSSIYFGWFFYPFVGYRTDDQHEFDNTIQAVHNFVVAFLSPLIYLIIALKLFFDFRKNRQHFGAVVSEMSAIRKRTFLQVFFVSMINSMTASLYVIIQYNEPQQWMITLAEFSWLHIHGFPPVIYLALNKTMRTDCRLLYMKVFKRHRIGHIDGVTILRSDLNPTTNSAPRAS